MCELRPYRCPGCSSLWEEHKKLASCEDSDPEKRCPENLCMYVGDPKRRRTKECESCVLMRQFLDECEEMGYLDVGVEGDQGQKKA